MRGGTVFPLQKEARNTEIARTNPWILLVALDDLETAQGDLFMDDGISQNTVENENYSYVTYEAGDSSVRSNIVVGNYSPLANEFIDTIEIVGIKSSQINSVQLNSEEIAFVYNNGRLTLTNLEIFFRQEFVLSYS